MTDIYSYKYAFQWDVYRLLPWPLGEGGSLSPFTETCLHRESFTQIPFHRDLFSQRPPSQRSPPPQETDLQTQTLLDRDNPGRTPPWTGPPWTETPQKEHGTGRRDPREGTWDKAARQEVTSYRDPLARMTGTRL